ncbi:MAG: dihydrofolate reductase [Pseudoflavonifractor sp.]|nr:dihydrofolate reductase [Alloprevotella sp.]MCM1117537.1 dihydrofolate reductase [Pseudoflavonifractor sp.]
MPPISIIAAIAANRAIGLRGDMLFHISADLRRFKAITMGKPLVMGRKTFESLPGGPLPGRRNIVVTRQASCPRPGIETAPSLADALSLAATSAPEEIMVIGGGEIYSQALPLASRLYLTEIDALPSEADTFFPPLPPGQWAVSETDGPFTDPRSGLTYRFVTLTRLKLVDIQR